MSVRVFIDHEDARGVLYDSLYEALVEPPRDPASYVSWDGVVYAESDQGVARWRPTATGKVRLAAEVNGGYAKPRPGTSKALEVYRATPYVSEKELASWTRR